MPASSDSSHTHTEAGEAVLIKDLTEADKHRSARPELWLSHGTNEAKMLQCLSLRVRDARKKENVLTSHYTLLLLTALKDEELESFCHLGATAEHNFNTLKLDSVLIVLRVRLRSSDYSLKNKD